MEREILFRGKKNNGEWLYGDLVKRPPDYLIFPLDAPNSHDNYIVDVNTIGQFTGVNDKNGTKIFEGDIIVSQRQLPFYNQFEENETGGELVMVNHIVEWFQNSAEFSLTPIGYNELMNESLCLSNFQEVIGNIHDNKI